MKVYKANKYFNIINSTKLRLILDSLNIVLFNLNSIKYNNITKILSILSILFTLTKL